MILVVEDNADIRELLAYILKKNGCSVSTCTDGAEALVAMRVLKPTVVIMDLNMPRIDGTEVLRQMRQEKELADIAVVVVSAFGAPDFIHRARELGAVAYMQKPADVPSLLKLIKDTREAALIQRKSGASPSSVIGPPSRPGQGKPT